MTRRAGDLGESGLIERLLARIGARGEGVVVGPGDDAAAVRIGSETLLLTADLLLEGVHFEIGLSSPSDVGWKALAVNVSDVAAMGGVPRFALVSLGAPSPTPSATLEQLYEGLGGCASACGVAVVGGDTIRADRLIVSVAVVGEAGDAGIVTRAGARPGHALCVTGTVGGAAAGLELLRAAGDDERAGALLAEFPGLAGAHRRPAPRLREGCEAARSGATAMIDLSDGLGRDAGHLAEASGIGVRLIGNAIPLAPGVIETARWAGRDPLELGVGGGDDYELAIALPRERVEDLTAALAPTPVALVGEFVDEARTVLDRDDETAVGLSSFGWDHFAEGS